MRRQWWTPEMNWTDVHAYAMKYPSWHSPSCVCLRCKAQDWAFCQSGGTLQAERDIYRAALMARPPDHGGTVEEVDSIVVRWLEVHPLAKQRGIEEAHSLEDVQAV